MIGWGERVREDFVMVDWIGKVGRVSLWCERDFWRLLVDFIRLKEIGFMK